MSSTNDISLASDFNALNVEIARRFNAITKFVATHRPESLTWQNSRGLGTEVAATVRELKKQDEGPTLLAQGSSELVHLLFAHDLVDELRLLTYPLVLGRGKRSSGRTLRRPPSSSWPRRCRQMAP